MNERLKHTGDLLQLDKNQFIRIPLFVADKVHNFEKIVDDIHIAKKNDQDTSNLEDEIDQLVYKLYDLTDEEISIVEKASN